MWNPLQTSIAMGESNGVVFNPAAVALGELTAAFGQRGMGNNGLFLFFIRFLCFGLIFLLDWV